ncbi:MAG TPA: hypothetical protein VH855_06025 [Acetobacteraceae bacterium]|jgi:hypothetical protein
MANLYLDSRCTDDERRLALYRGDLFVYSPSEATKKLCSLAQSMIEEAFSPHDPLRVDRVLSMEECAATLAKLKPAFIHHPKCKSLLPEIIEEHGGDPDKIYFDVPRMRSAYPKDYLTSGIAYAFHPHRDTWYSAPTCQINWWLPIYPITSENCLAFYPGYFSRGVKNTSEIYNYYEWNKRSRAEAAKHVKSDERVQPKPQQAIDGPDLRLLCAPGGMIVFSGAQLHETVPNTSGLARYSIDFRTVHYDDVVGHLGAPNVDSRCTGTTMRDYLRCSDQQRLPDQVIASYDDGTELSNDVLIFAAEQH